MYLLDTNHCSKLMDGDSNVIIKLRELGDVTLSTCVVVAGELTFMAMNSEKKAENSVMVKNFLDDIEVYNIDSNVAKTYGHFKAQLMSHFGPTEKAKRRKFKLKKQGLDDNDIWIASIALNHGLTVVSCDKNFKQMREVNNLELENWLKS